MPCLIHTVDDLRYPLTLTPDQDPALCRILFQQDLDLVLCRILFMQNQDSVLFGIIFNQDQDPPEVSDPESDQDLARGVGSGIGSGSLLRRRSWN